MKVRTVPFGEIEVKEERIITMEEGIIGFPYATAFVLLRQRGSGPFFWYQALNDEKLAFLVIDPFLVKPDYDVLIDDYVVKKLAIAAAKEVVLLSILTFHEENKTLTANLLAPLVINAANRKAKQVILEEFGYPLQYPIGSDLSAMAQQEEADFLLHHLVETTP